MTLLAHLRRFVYERRAVVLPLVVAAAMAVAFFTGREPRGPTARLDSDAYYYYVALPSLVVDHDLNLSNQYAAFGNWYGFGETTRGRPGNVFGIGPAIFATPFFLFGRALAWGFGSRLDGFSPFEIAATLFASVAATVLALVFATRFLRRRLGEGSAPAIVSLVVLLAGPVVYYAIRQPGYAHPFGTLFAAWLVDAWDESYEGGAARSRRTWLVLGALFGATVLARPQLVTWGVLLVAALVDDLRRARAEERMRVLSRVALATAAAVLVFTPQLWAWRALYGSALLVPQGAGFLAWSQPALTEVLFSARNGLLAWSPVYAVALVGLALEVRARAGALLLLAVGLQVFVNGAAWDWWAGGSFGGRRFCSTYVAFAFGLGALFVRARRLLEPRAPGLAAHVGLVFGTLLVVGNVGLAFTYGSSTVRIGGGQRPAAVMREQLAATLGVRYGEAYGLASDIVLALPRTLFALRYGTTWTGYDQIVGVFHLDELFPGLNVGTPVRTSHVRLTGPHLPPYALGLDPSPRGAILRRPRAAVLFALNEHRPVIDLEVDTPNDVRLLWNGRELAATRSGPTLKAGVGAFRRGVNVLEIEGAPGATLRAMRLQSQGP